MPHDYVEDSQDLNFVINISPCRHRDDSAYNEALRVQLSLPPFSEKIKLRERTRYSGRSCCGDAHEAGLAD